MVNHTKEELARRRALLVEEIKIQMYLGCEITCDNCGAKATCDSAFDLYNTNGDCLEDK